MFCTNASSGNFDKYCCSMKWKLLDKVEFFEYLLLKKAPFKHVLAKTVRFVLAFSNFGKFFRHVGLKIVEG